MIRDVVTRGFGGYGDGLFYVVTAGYDLGAALTPHGPGEAFPEEVMGVDFPADDNGVMFPSEVYGVYGV